MSHSVCTIFAHYFINNDSSFIDEANQILGEVRSNIDSNLSNYFSREYYWGQLDQLAPVFFTNQLNEFNPESSKLPKILELKKPIQNLLELLQWFIKWIKYFGIQRQYYMVIITDLDSIDFKQFTSVSKFLQKLEVIQFIKNCEKTQSRIKRCRLIEHSHFLPINIHTTGLISKTTPPQLVPIINEIRKHFYPTEQVHLTIGSKEFPICLMTDIGGVFKNIKNVSILFPVAKISVQTFPRKYTVSFYMNDQLNKLSTLSKLFLYLKTESDYVMCLVNKDDFGILSVNGLGFDLSILEILKNSRKYLSNLNPVPKRPITTSLLNYENSIYSRQSSLFQILKTFFMALRRKPQAQVNLNAMNDNIFRLSKFYESKDFVIECYRQLVSERSFYDVNDRRYKCLNDATISFEKDHSQYLSKFNLDIKLFQPQKVGSTPTPVSTSNIIASKDTQDIVLKKARGRPSRALTLSTTTPQPPSTPPAISTISTLSTVSASTIPPTVILPTSSSSVPLHIPPNPSIQTAPIPFPSLPQSSSSSSNLTPPVRPNRNRSRASSQSNPAWPHPSQIHYNTIPGPVKNIDPIALGLAQPNSTTPSSNQINTPPANSAPIDQRAILLPIAPKPPISINGPQSGHSTPPSLPSQGQFNHTIPLSVPLRTSVKAKRPASESPSVIGSPSEPFKNRKQSSRKPQTSQKRILPLDSEANPSNSNHFDTQHNISQPPTINTPPTFEPILSQNQPPKPHQSIIPPQSTSLPPNSTPISYPSRGPRMNLSVNPNQPHTASYSPSQRSPNSHSTAENRPDVFNSAAKSMGSYYDRAGSSNTIPPKVPSTRAPRKSNINSLLSDSGTYSPRENAPQSSNAPDHHFSRPPIVHPNSIQNSQPYQYHSQSNNQPVLSRQDNLLHQPRVPQTLHHDARTQHYEPRNGNNHHYGSQDHIVPPPRQPSNIQFTPILNTLQTSQGYRKPTPFQDTHNILSNPTSYQVPNRHPEPTPPNPTLPVAPTNPQPSSRRGKGSINHLLN